MIVLNFMNIITSNFPLSLFLVCIIAFSIVLYFKGIDNRQIVKRVTWDDSENILGVAKIWHEKAHNGAKSILEAWMIGVWKVVLESD